MDRVIKKKNTNSRKYNFKIESEVYEIFSGYDTSSASKYFNIFSLSTIFIFA